MKRLAGPLVRRLEVSLGVRGETCHSSSSACEFGFHGSLAPFPNSLAPSYLGSLARVIVCYCTVINRVATCHSYLFFRDEEIVVVLPPYVKGTILSATRSLFTDNATGSDAGGIVSWTPRRANAASIAKDVLQSIRLPRGAGRVVQLVFHRKGDYFSSLCKFYDIIHHHPKPLFDSPLTDRFNSP